MIEYSELVRNVQRYGMRRENRTGVDTVSAFGINYSVDLSGGFPLLTTKKMSWKNIVIENMWFLSGSNNVWFMRQHGCRFWDPWADEHGIVPSAYGHFWRRFPVLDPSGRITIIDQLSHVEQELRSNPWSRRLVVTAWDPGHAAKSALPPCHAFFVFNAQPGQDGGRPRLNLHLTQRSADVALGVPYNIAGYALLLHLFARFADMDAGTFSHSIVDAHIYTSKEDGSMAEYNHIPGLMLQISRKPKPRQRAKLSIDPKLQRLADVDDFLRQDPSTSEIMQAFSLEGYDPYPAIPFKVAV